MRPPPFRAGRSAGYGAVRSDRAQAPTAGLAGCDACGGAVRPGEIWAGPGETEAQHGLSNCAGDIRARGGDTPKTKECRPFAMLGCAEVVHGRKPWESLSFRAGSSQSRHSSHTSIFTIISPSVSISSRSCASLIFSF